MTAAELVLVAVVALVGTCVCVAVADVAASSLVRRLERRGRARGPRSFARMPSVTAQPVGRLGVPSPLPASLRSPGGLGPARVVATPGPGHWASAHGLPVRRAPAPTRRPAGVLDALAGGPLTLRELTELLGWDRELVYRELAAHLTAPPDRRPVEFVTATPGNPAFGLADAALPAP